MKIGNLDISSFKVGAADCSIYLGDTKLYPTAPPAFQGKWLATYTGGSVTSADCDASSAITNGEINKTGLTSVEIGDCVTNIGNSAFTNCTSLTSVIIPDSVASIGQYAFLGCYALSSATIPNSVTSISDFIFNYCSSLTGITIPSGVTSIGSQAFRNCSSLTSITIPSGVTSIGNFTFYYCSGLASITVNATTPPTLGSNPFNKTNDCPIYVPEESVNTYKSASGWSSYSSRIQAIP